MARFDDLNETMVSTNADEAVRGESREGLIARSKLTDIAKFDGSFAPTARPTEGPPCPWYKDREYFTEGWLDPSIWKAALIEVVATAALVYVSGNIGTTLKSYGNTPLVGAYIGISTVFLLSVFIYATAALTGGHLNPMISFCAIFTGLCPVSRGTLYMAAQTLGGALAGGILAGVYGHSRSIEMMGCSYDAAEITTGQVFLNEVVGSFVLLYLAYGVGLDPRQALLFGPRLGPVLVASSLGLIVFATSGIAPGYTGAAMNPARCFALAIAKRDMSEQWIWWVGPVVAATVMALLYNLVQPHPHEKRPKNSLPTLPVIN